MKNIIDNGLQHVELQVRLGEIKTTHYILSIMHKYIIRESHIIFYIDYEVYMANIIVILVIIVYNHQY